MEEQPKEKHPPKKRTSKRRTTISERRKQISALKKAYKLVQIDLETFEILLIPSDRNFALPIAVLDFDLKVSRHYPHKGKASVHINNSNIPRGYALNVETAFDTMTGTLVERIKSLDQRLEELLTKEPRKTMTIMKPRPKVKTTPSSSNPLPSLETLNVEPSSETHSSSESSYSVTDQEEESESQSDQEQDGNQEQGSQPERRGTELVLPDLQMSNISLLEIISLNLIVCCGRCKNLQVFANLMSPPYGREGRPLSESCTKCGLTLAVAFRKEYMHAFSTTAGFLDIAGGTFDDLQPSSFLGICENCNEQGPIFKHLELGKNAVQNCRHCHAKMSLLVDEFRFDLISTDTIGSVPKASGAPKKEAKLRLIGGQPLPNNATCKHYKRSQRWFRFGCCRRIFPCDRCHDEELDHPADHALRMLCGFCSREQNFVEVCKFCGHSYATRTTAFWEGGRGTRDPRKMSRKDPRKFKRIGSNKAK